MHVSLGSSALGRQWIRFQNLLGGFMGSYKGSFKGPFKGIYRDAIRV